MLTGFLGAGKTTLLNRILNGSHGLRGAVLVNDFGSINIDADLVVGVESDVISLANGCVCCSIRGDLSDAVTRVLARPERPDYVLLEAGGVAEPSGIAMTFADASLRDRIRLDSITCVVDAEQVFALPEQMRLKLWQIGFADMLILNKVDLVSREQVAKIKQWLGEHFHRFRLIEATQGEVPLEILLSAGRFGVTQSEHEPRNLEEHLCQGPHSKLQHNDHAHTFSTCSYESEEPLSLEALRRFAASLPANIYRCKGLVYSIEAPHRRAVLQVVGKRADISLQDEWGSRPPRTQIVTIGAQDGLDTESLRAMFDRCLSIPTQS